MDKIVGLFSSDLFRSLAVGFVAGVLGLAAVSGVGREQAPCSLIAPVTAAPDACN